MLRFGSRAVVCCLGRGVPIRCFSDTLALLPQPAPDLVVPPHRDPSAPSSAAAGSGGLVARGEVVVLTSEDWDVVGGEYTKMRMALEKMFRAGKVDAEAALERRERIDSLLQVRYPPSSYILDRLQTDALEGLKDSAMRKLRQHRKYKTMIDWCDRFLPAGTSAVPVSTLIDLRDSFRRYVKGTRIAHLRPPVGTTTKSELLLPRAHPLHGIEPPHPAVLELMRQRLHQGKRLRRIERILGIGGDASAFLLTMLDRHGAGRGGCQMLSADSAVREMAQDLIPKLRPREYSELRSLKGKYASKFDLVVHCPDGVAPPRRDIIEQGRVPSQHPRDLLRVLRTAEKVLNPGGRLLLVFDNLAELVDAPCAVETLLKTPEGRECHGMELERLWEERCYDNPSLVLLPGQTITPERAKGRPTGLQHKGDNTLPPGPFKQALELERMKELLLKGHAKRIKFASRLKKYQRNRKNLMVHFNSQPYEPEQPRPLEKLFNEKLGPEMRVRMLLLRKRGDTSYCPVNFAQHVAEGYDDDDDDE
eukprot:Hpha_TRINITY_DN15094_c2_g1::TRINITY_DN15094_c2_g1_i1::g.123817::m.123817